MDRPCSRRWRVSAVVPVLLFVGSSLSLTACSHTAVSAPCTASQMNLTLEKTTRGTLPPTHDNDAGKGRIPDAQPDADVDANQRAALCKIYKSEHHLPG